MNQQPIQSISINNEYSPLKSVIIGIADPEFRFPQENEDLSFEYMLKTGDITGICEYFNGANRGHFPASLIQQENDKLDTIADTLSELGIQVYRPKRNAVTTHLDVDVNLVQTKFWEAKTYMQAHCPRDLILVVDNNIIITPTMFRGRRKEIEYFYLHIFKNIKDNCSNAKFIDLRSHSPLKDELFSSHDTKAITESEPLFDAASILKIADKTLLYQVSPCSNKTGMELLQATLPDVEIIPLNNWYNGLHIDSTLSILNKKSILFNPERCTYTQCKETFSRYGFKQFIACPDDIYDHGHIHISTSSKWIAMNVLVINPELVMIDEKQTKLMNVLKSECNMSSLPVAMPFGRDFGGGAHCISLGLERDSG